MQDAKLDSEHRANAFDVLQQIPYDKQNPAVTEEAILAYTKVVKGNISQSADTADVKSEGAFIVLLPKLEMQLQYGRAKPKPKSV